MLEVEVNMALLVDGNGQSGSVSCKLSAIVLQELKWIWNYAIPKLTL